MQNRNSILQLLYTFAASSGITALTGCVLFIAAWRIDLPMFWAFLGLIFVSSLVGFYGIDPDLIKERQQPGPGGVDYVAMHVAKFFLATCLILAGLDVGRFHWSDSIPFIGQIIALVFMAISVAVALWAMIVNRYFSSVVRIQTERGHELITTGPYKYVRHPGYTALLVTGLTLGIALGSWYSCIPAMGYVLLILRRVIIEDKFLHENMEGYVDYSKTVRWRLLPGIW